MAAGVVMFIFFLAAAVPRCAALAVGTPRAGVCRASPMRASSSVTMLEAFDLMPVVECLKLDGMDAVQECMDSISPWMEIDDEGNLNFSLNAVNGFIGGSVGVIGTVLSTMVKKNQVKDRLKCTYCDGTGQILCGHCLGSGTLSYMDENGALASKQCGNCEGSGTVVCINCQGSGLTVPEEFLTKLGDEEVGFTEEDYIGLFDETSKAPKTEVMAGAGAAASAASGEGDKPQRSPEPPRPEDYTGMPMG
eukprot:CAMPEP_0115854730 /NCGR_PEP_ID=MMETSP0287-20121206/14177_1 /TAXON_ID=412157 /ORGANISM="Chrysochromulina rotalis, Strain UIO044" /LENGTH=248 /DNA_ID=CAMNT_0003308861 /DNA_START=24 /DNA_END=770 /DNA_ORIENTATION=-